MGPGGCDEPTAAVPPAGVAMAPLDGRVAGIDIESRRLDRSVGMVGPLIRTRAVASRKIPGERAQELGHAPGLGDTAVRAMGGIAVGDFRDLPDREVIGGGRGHEPFETGAKRGVLRAMAPGRPYIK